MYSERATRRAISILGSFDPSANMSVCLSMSMQGRTGDSHTKVPGQPLLSSQTTAARGLRPDARGALELLLRAGVALAVHAMQVVGAALAVPGHVPGQVLLRRHLEDRTHVVELRRTSVDENNS